jgi:hypothetical protein
MKVWNIVILSLLLAILGSMSVSVLAGKFLQNPMPVSMILSFIIGFKARSIVESTVGYTLTEAMDEERKNHVE